MPAIWTDVIEAGAVVSLVGVPYLVLDKRKRLPHLAFDVTGVQRQAFAVNGHQLLPIGGHAFSPDTAT